MSDKPKFTESSGNVFEDLGFSKEEAAALLMRSELMVALARELRRTGKPQRELGEILGIGQSRVSDLIQGKAKLFSLDMLITLAQRIGMHVRLERAVQARPLAEALPAESFASFTTHGAATAAHVLDTLGAAFGTIPAERVSLYADAAGAGRAHIRRLIAADSSERPSVYLTDDLRASAA